MEKTHADSLQNDIGCIMEPLKDYVEMLYGHLAFEKESAKIHTLQCLLHQTEQEIEAIVEALEEKIGFINVVRESKEKGPFLAQKIVDIEIETKEDERRDAA